MENGTEEAGGLLGVVKVAVRAKKRGDFEKEVMLAVHDFRMRVSVRRLLALDLRGHWD